MNDKVTKNDNKSYKSVLTVNVSLAHNVKVLCDVVVSKAKPLKLTITLK